MQQCCQSTNGLEQVTADTIYLNGSNLQTELNTLQTEIDSLKTAFNANIGGAFVMTCERVGYSANGFFSWGASGTTSTYMRISSDNALLTKVTISFSDTPTISTVVRVQFLSANYYDITIPTTTNTITYVLPTVDDVSNKAVRVLFVSGSFGTANNATVVARVCLGFLTNGVVGSNGTNGTNGTNGQNVNFYAPSLSNLTPIQTPFCNDTITTSSGTQNHQLAFGIPRGKNSNFTIGTVTAGAAPAVNMVSTVDGSGDNAYVLNFQLQTGPQGAQGAQGPQGQDGNADPVVIATATTAGLAAGGSAGTVSGSIAGASSGSIAGALAGTQSAQAVVAPVQIELDQLQLTVAQRTQNFKNENIPSVTTEIHGEIVNLYPSSTVNVGGSYGIVPVISTANVNLNATNNITIDSDSTISLNSNTMTLAGNNIILQGNTKVASDLSLERFLDWDTGAGYKIATVDVYPSVGQNTNNTGIMNISTGSMNLNGQLNLYTGVHENNHSYFRLMTDFNSFAIGSIVGQTNTVDLPASENGGKMGIYARDLFLGYNGTTETISLSANSILIGQNVSNTNIEIGTLNQSDIYINTGTFILQGNSITIGEISPPANTVVIDIVGEHINVGNQLTSINEIRGGHIQIGNDGGCDTVEIGSPSTYVEIEGDDIKIGVGTIQNTISIGNSLSTINIASNPFDAISVSQFFNQLGF